MARKSNPPERIRDLQVEWVNPEDLRPYERNPRQHSRSQIRKLARSLEAFGWTNPLLTDGANGLIAGHGRLEAALTLGMEQVPIIELPDLTPAQRKAYVVADNQLATLAEWDEGLLAAEVADLAEHEFDLSLTGIDEEQLAAMLGKPVSFTAKPGRPSADDDVPYREQYAVNVVCEDAAHQEKVYDDLRRQGYDCRVVVV